MEFGRVPGHELNSIDFSLPAEPTENQQILSGKKYEGAKVYLGCPKWGSSEWVGQIYPPKTKEKDFLQHYVQHFNSIELNATHYKIYGAAAIAKWAAQAKGMDFKFCPKMYQGVTHRGSLMGKDLITDEFFRGIVAFEEHLGPVFLQMSDAFSPNRKEELFAYLKSLPTDLQFFLEVRHPDWFAKPAIADELFDTLATLKIGAVITDTAGRRDCAHMRLPIPKVFIRYVGNSLHPTDYTRAHAWVERIKHWLNKGLQELYFFMHMQDDVCSPEFAGYLTGKLNAACGLKLIKPKFIENAGSDNSTQISLFD